MEFDKSYWEKLFIEKDMPWDIGYVSTPIKEYIDQLTDKELKILIPGCGNGYEAEYLFSKGFKNVYILDWSDIAINNFLTRFPQFPQSNIFNQDFFIHTPQYDLIIEQTFFCALHPSMREQYVKKMHELLLHEGKLAGLLFNRQFSKEGPPFGGTKEEYRELFESYFHFKHFDECYNSIPPRAGNELFINFTKKKFDFI